MSLHQEIQFQSNEFSSDILTYAYISELLINIGKIKLYDKPDYLFSLFENNSFIVKVLEYIDTNIYSTLKINDIAKELFVSRSYLSKEFSKIMDVTLQDYIKQKKLFYICQELNKGTNLNDICAKYSIGDYSTLYILFIKEYGLTPKQYILNINNK